MYPVPTDGSLSPVGLCVAAESTADSKIDSAFVVVADSTTLDDSVSDSGALPDETMDAGACVKELLADVAEPRIPAKLCASALSEARLSVELGLVCWTKGMVDF